MTKDTSLAPLTTLGVGGDADRLLKLSNETELIEALQDAETQNVRTYILGGGSNIVFDDGGFEGWVLRPEQCALRFDAHGEDVKVYAEAGLPWDALVHACVEQGLAGVEAMSGIPGHVGAAPIQNIGAYGQELSNSLTSVRAYDRANKKIVQLSNDACQFEYRSSIFKRHGAGAYVILSVELTLRLSTGELPLRYHDLHQYFDGDTAPSVKALRDAVLAIRRSKGMVYSPDDPDSHSVGSFFLNPVVDADQRQELQAKAAAKGWTLPSYPQADGRHKVSAAWLIERAGVQRGERLGSAGISSKHVLALMNPGRATSADIRALARHVQERVAQAWGISLTPEVRILSSTGLDPSFYPAPLERSCPPHTSMTRQQRADRIADILEELYPETPIPLDHRDPFTLLVAVLLSAQSTDKKVNEITPALFDRAPTPAVMAEMEEEEIKHYIRQIGLANSKARALKKTATLLRDRHAGVVPQTFEELEELPGVGHKTASVVMAQAFDVPAFPVDTHIHRLALRWGLTRGTTVQQTEKDLKKLFPKERWNKLHLQIIFFGREYCPALYHDLSTCPICGWAATKKQMALEIKANRELREKRSR